MASLIDLMLLAWVPLVVGYLAWRYLFLRGITTHDRQQATNDQGERTMTSVMVGSEEARVIRWMDEGRTVFEDVRRLLHECTQVKGVADAAQQECERLQRTCEELHEEVRLLKAETERLQQERTETAHWFTAKMKEVGSRFWIEPRPREQSIVTTASGKYIHERRGLSALVVSWELCMQAPSVTRRRLMRRWSNEGRDALGRVVRWVVHRRADRVCDQAIAWVGGTGS